MDAYSDTTMMIDFGNASLNESYENQTSDTLDDENYWTVSKWINVIGEFCENILGCGGGEVFCDS